MKHQKLFYWTALNSFGKKINGDIVAENKAIALIELRSKQLTVLVIRQKNHFLNLNAQRFKLKDLVYFTQQCQLLLQADISLLDTLSLMIKTSASEIMIKMIKSLQEKIMTGLSFSSALAQFPEYFNSTYCHLIAAGEKSGQLNTVLLQLIQMLEHQLLMKNKIRRAFFYPLMVLCIAILVTIALIIFVIPQFSTIYRNFNAKLPMMTQYLMNLSQAILQHAFLCLIFLGLTGLFIKMVMTQKSVRAYYQRFLFFMTPIRSLIITQQISQWAQLLSTLLSAYIPLIDALQIANNTISHVLIQKSLNAVREKMITGISFYDALNMCSIMPITAKQMIGIGENADALAIMLQKIAVIYQQKLNDTLNQLTQLIEPVMMIGVSSLITGLIVAMYLPIFRMGSII